MQFRAFKYSKYNMMIFLEHTFNFIKQGKRTFLQLIQTAVELHTKKLDNHKIT